MKNSFGEAMTQLATSTRTAAEAAAKFRRDLQDVQARHYVDHLDRKQRWEDMRAETTK